MTPEQKQRLGRIRKRQARYKKEPYAPDLWWDDTNFLLSLVKEQEAESPPAEELTAAFVLDQSLNTLRQIRDLTASSRSYVPQDNAAEMMLRLDGLGFGSQEPRRGNTLWAMVMDATDEIEKLRKSDAATAMRSRCVEKVKEKAIDWQRYEMHAREDPFRAQLFYKYEAAVEIIKHLESLSIEKEH